MENEDTVYFYKLNCQMAHEEELRKQGFPKLKVLSWETRGILGTYILTVGWEYINKQTRVNIRI